MLDFLYEDYPHDITCIDTGLGRPCLAACYLMQQEDRLAIIETGIAKTVPRILQLIEERGFSRDQVDYVIITHVHLDHAGGAGGLMQALPNAKLVAHPRAARHMIDPAKLQAGAMAVYGEELYRATYGELIPIPEDRIIIAGDEFIVDFNGRPMQFFDTPGHARHHFCVHDKLSGGIFTGDTLGIVYRELCRGGENFVMPSTTPVQFEPEKLKASIDRLMQLRPDYFYLTHFGRVPATANHAQSMHHDIDAYVAVAKQHAKSDNRNQVLTDALIELTLKGLADYQTPLAEEKQRQLIAMDMSINAQGLEVWLEKQEMENR